MKQRTVTLKLDVVTQQKKKSPEQYKSQRPTHSHSQESHSNTILVRLPHRHCASVTMSSHVPCLTEGLVFLVYSFSSGFYKFFRIPLSLSPFYT